MGDFTKQLIFGGSGSGKTVYAATSQDVKFEGRPANVLLVNADNQLHSIKSRVELITHKELGKVDNGKISVIRSERWIDLVKVYDWLLSPSNCAKYDFSILDGVTELSDQAVQQSVPGGDVVSLQPKKVERQHYGDAYWMVKNLFRGFRDLPLHVIYTALPKDQEGIDSSIQYLKPALYGKMTEHACALTEFVGYLSATPQDVRELSFKMRGKIYGRDRTEEGLLGNKIVSPTVQKFLDLLGTRS